MPILIFVFTLFSFNFSLSQSDATLRGRTDSLAAQNVETHLYCNCGTGLYVLLEDPNNRSEIETARAKGVRACQANFPGYGESTTPTSDRRAQSIRCEIKPKNKFFCLFNFFNSGTDENDRVIQEFGLALDMSSPNLEERQRAELTQRDPTTSHLINCFPAGQNIEEDLERYENIETDFRQACASELRGYCGTPWGVENASVHNQMRCLHDRKHTLRGRCKNFFYP